MIDDDLLRPRRRRGIFYVPYKISFFAIFAAIFGIVLILLFLDIVGAAFKTLFPTLGAGGVLLLLGSSLLGSYVNIPIHRVTSRRPIIRVRYVNVFGVTYHVPIIEHGAGTTLIAVNLGGAVVPTLVSIYALTRSPSSIPYALAATVFVTAVTKLVSRPVLGVGIIAPSLVPPLNAALVATLMGTNSHIVAYVAGTMGTLIGADLLNLRTIPRLGSPIVSIGGAGTFDGIFFSGIVAVILAA